MKRSLVSRTCLLLLLGFSSLGCEYRRDQSVRRTSGDPLLSDSSTVASEDAETKLAKSQHSGGRRPAALSEEAREIESHFNVR